MVSFKVQSPFFFLSSVFLFPALFYMCCLIKLFLSSHISCCVGHRTPFWFLSVNEPTSHRFSSSSAVLLVETFTSINSLWVFGTLCYCRMCEHDCALFNMYVTDKPHCLTLLIAVAGISPSEVHTQSKHMVADQLVDTKQTCGCGCHTMMYDMPHITWLILINESFYEPPS